ncbi:hypothetical protein PAXINDRAFT_101022 [Paxillus involutus ATCC 200175]|uniref:F-box domain-containing protein n=1 Tax=Paxillus involutus ATCC 200175 TaxID=664439 RepID=A0A0C9TQN7_PAXIN|nr:hypothetical protein PAXINDRAFT_101022 [Paxillus involutus ATCC 200175]
MACATTALEELDNKKIDLCHVLYITEILRNILDNLMYDKKSLFRIAVSCRAFSGPALDTLWAFIPSFDPFIPLLPENVRQGWELAHTLEDLSHMQCPAEEWRVFDSYARRVHDLACGGSTLPRLAAYQQLGILRPNSLIFPHLKALQFSIYVNSGPGTLMFPSSLRTLQISHMGILLRDTSRWHSYTELALHQVAQDVPLLEVLAIAGMYHLPPGGEPRPLPFQALHTVHFSPFLELEPRLFDHFSRLLSTAPVRFLTVHTSNFSPLFDGSDESDDKTPMFLNVEVLNIIADPQTAGDIVSRVGSPHLHAVTLESEPGSSPGLGQFFSALAQRPGPIRSLNITLGDVEPSGVSAGAHINGFLQILEPVVSAGLERLKANIPMKRASQVRSSVWKRLDEGCWPALEYVECNLTDAVTGESVITVVQF